jgi:AraC family transcriptional regulator
MDGICGADLNEIPNDGVHRVLFTSPQIVVGEFHCLPGDPRWSRENCADGGYFVAFPGTSVVIAQAGRAPAVVTRNELVFYNRGQRYRRGLVDPSGDHCFFLMVAPSLLAEMSATLGSAQDVDRLAFSSHLGPVSSNTFLLHRLVVYTLRGHSPVVPDVLRLEEALHHLVLDAARIGFDATQPKRRRSRGHTLSAHAILVERTKALLARRFAERLSLTEIAREMHVSPFHLVRIFRSGTGFGIHQYRDQLRLRFALDRIYEDDVTLSALARELGYASHSHFTDSFRRVFGVPPSAVRPSARALCDLREKLVARP